MKNAVCTWTYDPVLTDKKTSLHKHKMGARDSMLGYLISCSWHFPGGKIHLPAKLLFSFHVFNFSTTWRIMAMILACPMSPPIMSNLPSQRNQRSSLSPRDTLPTSPGDNMPTIPGAQRSSTPQHSPAGPSSTTTQPNPLRATQMRKISQHSLVGKHNYVVIWNVKTYVSHPLKCRMSWKWLKWCSDPPTTITTPKLNLTFWT